MMNKLVNEIGKSRLIIHSCYHLLLREISCFVSAVCFDFPAPLVVNCIKQTL